MNVINTPKKRIVVVDGKIEVRNTIMINVTFDHRFADGSDGAHMIKATKEVM